MLQTILSHAFSALKKRPSDYCDIETIDGTYDLVLKDGTLMTILHLHGLTSNVSNETYSNMLATLASQISKQATNKSYKMAFLFTRDSNSEYGIDLITRRKKQVAKDLGLDVEMFIDEEAKVYSNDVYNENVYLSVITEPGALSKAEMEMDKRTKSGVSYPATFESQNPFLVSKALKSKHTAFVNTISSVLGRPSFCFSHTRLNVVDAIRAIRSSVKPSSNPVNYRPYIPVSGFISSQTGGSNKPVSPMLLMPRNTNTNDISPFIAPPISEQVMSSSIEEIPLDKEIPLETIRTDGKLFSSFFMKIPPVENVTFQHLFAEFNKSSFVDAKGNHRTMPYSICFLISGDGLAKLALKKSLASLFALLPPHTNDNVKASIRQLEAYQNQNEPVVGLQMSAMTWAEDTPQGRASLKDRRTQLQSALESWGKMVVEDSVGDAFEGWRHSVLGLNNKMSSNIAGATLFRSLALMPLRRPTSPFPNGYVLHKSSDGKLMPLEYFSKRQASWSHCIIGTSGSGKSVKLNHELFEKTLIPGNTRLPLIFVLDVKRSSEGFVNIIRDGLPSHAKDQAVIRSFRKDESTAINIFDPSIGLTRPLPDEKEEMVAFMVSLLTPAERAAPYEGTSEFCSSVITHMFNKIQENEASATPKSYSKGADLELDNYLREFVSKEALGEEKGVLWYGKGSEEAEPISYYELTRRLHKLGESFGQKYGNSSSEKLLAWKARNKAHRLASPLLTDFATAMEEDSIRSIYKEAKVGQNESLISYAGRMISTIQDTYKCFTRPTNFEVDSARIVVLDMDEVLDPNNKKQCSLFFQAGRMIATRKMSLDDGCINEDYIHPDFLDYYKVKARELKEDKKTLVYEELRNVTDDSSTMTLLKRTMHEGRKEGIELILVSQEPSHYYFKNTQGKQESLLDSATMISLISPLGGNEAKLFLNNFEGATDLEMLSKDMQRPGLSSAGSTFLLYVKTKDQGPKIFSLPTLKVGDLRLWGLTTDPDERVLRSRVFELTHNDRNLGLKILAAHFGSSASNRLEMARKDIKRHLGNDNSSLQVERKMTSVFDELAQEAFNSYMNNQNRLRQMG